MQTDRGDGIVTEPLAPRLLDRDGAARYLGVSGDTLDRLIHSGQISVVRLPVERQRKGAKGIPGTNRRILIDRAELDELIPRWRERHG
jgi:hypothetical protein